VKVSVAPNAGIEVLNEGVTSHGAESTIIITGEPTAGGLVRIVIRGKLGVDHPADWVRRRVPDPNRLTAELLRAALVSSGVAEPSTPLILGRSKRSPKTRQTLVRHESDDLATTISDINTWSNNYMAEVLFKELGRAPGKPASWERAAPRVTKRLAELGVEASELRIVNGSGLYRGTLVSPRAMTQLLVAMARDVKMGPVFRNSLARPGRPGTLSTRLKGLSTRERVWAKSGTLDEVVSLSGYVETSGGHGLAFAIIINDATPQRTQALRAAIDRLVATLARL
jgi:D-alanyl-D-alanine carboxypeptidase/D-alanyl-D-alanine-endopeptidase (penicillin-binding protein 4)